MDGVLDDPVYDQVPAAGGFLQQEPNEGASASESTRVWVFYDAENLYIAADLEHPGPLMAGEMRRDHMRIGWNDSFQIVLDTLL